MKKLALAALTVLTLPAAAQETQFGAHGALNIPIGDLSSATDGRPGVTVGGHLGAYYGDGHELRVRADFTHYAGGWHPSNGTFTRSTISAFGLAADYLFYAEGRPQGFYPTMGLGYNWWTVNPNEGPTESKTSLAFSAGAGYRFNRGFALEARFCTGQFQDNRGQASALQIMASLRF